VRPHAEPISGGCTPADIAFHHGGVARNIAQNLVLLGHEVKLASVFGDDSFAQGMRDACEWSGIDLSLSSQYENAASPLFLSFNDDLGNMQSALSDIKLNRCLDLDWIRDRIDAINRSDLVVADTLLSAEALSFLIDHCLVPLYIDTVSPNRALLFSEALRNSWKKSVFALKCNLVEAQALTGARDAEDAAKQLVSKGIKEVYLTMGEEGVCFCSKKGFRHFPAIETEAVNVTGSGDAFFAGVIHAHAVGIQGETSVEYGLKAACHNVKSEAPVNPTLRLEIFAN
jgi:pseudouridine kinase